MSELWAPVYFGQMTLRRRGALTTHCLIKCAGRKSGKVYVGPLIYGNVGGEIVIVASQGGADTHPGWYLNILESNTIGVQIAAQAFEATWREPKAKNAIRCGRIWLTRTRRTLLTSSRLVVLC